MDESSTLAGGESWVRVAAAVAAATLLLASIAAYNGFPLVGGDTGVILRVGNHLHVPTERSFAYAIYLRVLREIGGPWLVVLVDSLLAAMILYLTVRVLMERRSIGVYLTIIVGLVLLSSLPWFTGRLLPDVFSGILVLSMFLLGFGRHRLGRGATAFVVLVASCAIGFHLSHVPLSIGLFLVVLLLSFLLARARLPGISAPTWKLAGLLSAPILLGVLAFLVPNELVYHEVTLAPGSPIHILARLVGDGPARDYLREVCPRRPYLVCPYLGRLGSDWDFLYVEPVPQLRQLDQLDSLKAEAREIIRGTLREYPVVEATRAIDNSLHQFVTFPTGGELHPWLGDNMVQEMNATFGRQLGQEFETSRQSLGHLPLSTVTDTVVTVLCVPVLVLLLFLSYRRRRSTVLALLVVVLLGIVGNDVICGSLAEVDPRYGSRVIWLVVLAALAGAADLLPRLRNLSSVQP
jgi:hypothetical protein